MTSSRIEVQTTVSISPQKVWEAWTDPAHITQWNFAIDDWHCPRATNELRVGGKYFARMEAKDGSFGFDFEAVYDEVIDLKEITYTMADGRSSTTRFESLGDKTKVTTVFDAETQNSEELQRNGWQAILNNFKKYVEKALA